MLYDGNNNDDEHLKINTARNALAMDLPGVVS